MSTLEVACGRCEKRFRVRAEFGGRSTRCPGCSAPITIAGSARAAPHAEPEDRPRPRPRPRDEDDRPRRPAADWKPVDAALGREQAAVLFLLVSFVSSFLVVGLAAATAGYGGPPDPVILGVMLLLLFGPLLAAGAFGIAARVAALGAPADARSKRAAVSSLLCGLSAVGCVAVLGLMLLTTLGAPGPDPLAGQVTAVGAIAAGAGALATFAGLVAQVGIAHRSAEVSRALGRVAVGVCVCVLGPLGIAFLLALESAMSPPPAPGSFGYHHRPEEDILRVLLVVLVPLAAAVLLILYHRLLAAGRRAVQGEPAGRYDG